MRGRGLARCAGHDHQRVAPCSKLLGSGDPSAERDLVQAAAAGERERARGHGPRAGRLVAVAVGLGDAAAVDLAPAQLLGERKADLGRLVEREREDGADRVLVALTGKPSAGAALLPDRVGLASPGNLRRRGKPITNPPASTAALARPECRRSSRAAASRSVAALGFTRRREQGA